MTLTLKQSHDTSRNYSPVTILLSPLDKRFVGLQKVVQGSGDIALLAPRLTVALGSAWDLQIAVLFLLVPWELWHALGVRTAPQCTRENLLLKLPDGNTRKAKDDMTWKSRDLGCDATWITAAIESNALLNAIRKQLWTLQHRALFCSCIGWEACTELDGLELYKQGHCLYKHLWLYCTALPFSMCS